MNEKRGTYRRPPDVSDHAVLRYLERVMEFDIDSVRRRVQEICAGAGIGATTIRAEGADFIVKNNVVVTVRHRYRNVKRIPRDLIGRPEIEDDDALDAND